MEQENEQKPESMRRRSNAKEGLHSNHPDENVEKRKSGIRETRVRASGTRIGNHHLRTSTRRATRLGMLRGINCLTARLLRRTKATRICAGFPRTNGRTLDRTMCWDPSWLSTEHGSLTSKQNWIELRKNPRSSGLWFCF